MIKLLCLLEAVCEQRGMHFSRGGGIFFLVCQKGWRNNRAFKGFFLKTWLF